MAEEVVENLKICYSILTSVYPDKEKLDEANQFLQQFYTEPSSFEILLQYFKQEENEKFRLYTLIGLKMCIKNTFEKVDEESKRLLFENFIQLLVLEPNWHNRHFIIDLIIIISNVEYWQYLFDFIQSCIAQCDIPHLDIALSLSTLFPENLVELNGDGTIIDSFLKYIEIGFNNEFPEVYLSTMHFINNASFINLTAEEHPEYWDKCIETLNLVIGNPVFLSKYIKLVTATLAQNKIVTDPLPLLDKCLDLINENNPDENSFLTFDVIVQEICQDYKERVMEEPDLVKKLIAIYIHTAENKYDREDLLAISNANFFESTFSEICNMDTIEEMWSQINALDEGEEKLFVISRVMSATFIPAMDFYADKFQEIKDALTAGINSDSLLLLNSCALAACDFANCFTFESDVICLSFISDVVEACKKTPTSELFSFLGLLLDGTKKTDDIFDDIIAVLIAAIGECDPETRVSAIKCIASISRWSTIKIFKYCNDIITLLNGILDSDEVLLDQLKAPSIECISTIADSIGEDFSIYIPDLFGKFEAGLEHDELVYPCLIALEKVANDQIFVNEKKEDFEQILSFAKENSEIDCTEEFLKQKKSEFGNDTEYSLQFYKSAASIKLYSTIINVDIDVFDAHYQNVLNCCIKQSNSCAPVCQIAAMEALENLSRYIQPPSPAEMDIALHAGVIAVGLTSIGNDIDVIYQVLTIFSVIIQYIDISKINKIEELIGNIRNLLLSPDARSKRPFERGRDIFDAICTVLIEICSATSGSAAILEPLNDIFMEFLGSENLRFRSMALTLCSEMIRYGDSSIPEEIIQQYLECAVKMASEEVDGSCFAFLKRIADNNKDLLEPYLESARDIFMDKLNPANCQNIERYILMRDKCVKCFGTFLMKGLIPLDALSEGSYTKADVIVYSLAAMPIQIDFDGSQCITDFFFWLYDNSEGGFDEHFLRVLVILFSNHESIFQQYELSEYIKTRMAELFVQFCRSINDSEAKIKQILSDDELRLSFLEENVSRFITKEEEEVAFFDEC